MLFFQGLGAPYLIAERFPPCLRPARRDFAQAGLKLCHLTACPVLQGEWFFVNYDTVFWERGRENRLSCQKDGLDVPGA
jgi:hypothetical protein